MADKPKNPWKNALIEQLVVHSAYAKSHEKDPHKAVDSLLNASNDIALDPQVSSCAVELVQKGRDEALEEFWKKRAVTLITAFDSEEVDEASHVSGLCKPVTLVSKLLVKLDYAKAELLTACLALEEDSPKVSQDLAKALLKLEDI